MNLGSQFVRAGVRDLIPYNAGLGIEEVRRRFNVTRIAKLGSNESPFGPSPKVLAHVADGLPLLAHYPDPDCTALRAEIAARLGIEPDRLIFGNGSEDILAFACRAFINAGDEVVLSSPTFSVYRDNAHVMGARIVDVPRRADLHLDVPALTAALGPKIKILFLCNPNNPTGTAVARADFVEICRAADPQTLIVADEAYYEYACGDDYPESLDELKRLGCPYLVLRTFSKAYGLAALRIGYGIASDPALVRYLNLVRSAFNVNALAQLAARLAWSDQAHIDRVVRETLAERARVTGALRAMGYAPVESRANFLFFDLRRPSRPAADALLAKGVIVKPWAGGRFDTWIRASIGSSEENDQFLEALGSLD